MYWERDRYINVGANLHLPVSNLVQASIYGEPLSDHSNLSIPADGAQEYIENYFSSYDAGHLRPYTGTDYIKSDDIPTIIASSDYVLKVKLDEEVDEDIPKDRSNYNCTVVSVYKGDISPEDSTLIIFPKDSVTVGNEYIVALFDAGDTSSRRMFIFSSKNSLFDVSDENEILQYLTAPSDTAE